MARLSGVKRWLATNNPDIVREALDIVQNSEKPLGLCPSIQAPDHLFEPVFVILGVVSHYCRADCLNNFRNRPTFPIWPTIDLPQGSLHSLLFFAARLLPNGTAQIR